MTYQAPGRRPSPLRLSNAGGDGGASTTSIACGSGGALHNACAAACADAASDNTAASASAGVPAVASTTHSMPAMSPDSPLDDPAALLSKPLPSPVAQVSSFLSRPTRDVRQIVSSLSASVLAGVHCVFAGPFDMILSPGCKPPEVQLAERFGAVLSTQMSAGATHLLLPPVLIAAGALTRCARTQALAMQAHQLGILRSLHLVDLRWLLDCVAHWERLPEDNYATPLSQLCYFL
uniref:protein-serine/threonine phosphatase n=1 Tax=Chrysotila carterae TaxID=13221 RepID=A0A7S4F6P5_CHRCT